MNRKTLLSLCVFALVLIAMFFYGRGYWMPAYQKIAGKQTVEEVLANSGMSARSRIMPYFESAGVAYPPSKITFLAIKDTAVLELWAETPTEAKYIRTYPIKALSGATGPKLKEGDRQVPEGIYNIEGLNPNSAYHLSMKLDYPNAFDKKYAEAERRDKLGTNIFIHGKAVSIGCLAIGDKAIEELFTLAVDTGKSNITVAIAPSDPRNKKLTPKTSSPWMTALYQTLTDHFIRYKHQPG